MVRESSVTLDEKRVAGIRDALLETLVGQRVTAEDGYNALLQILGSLAPDEETLTKMVDDLRSTSRAIRNGG